MQNVLHHPVYHPVQAKILDFNSYMSVNETIVHIIMVDKLINPIGVPMSVRPRLYFKKYTQHSSCYFLTLAYCPINHVLQSNQPCSTMHFVK